MSSVELPVKVTLDNDVSSLLAPLEEKAKKVTQAVAKEQEKADREALKRMRDYNTVRQEHFNANKRMVQEQDRNAADADKRALARLKAYNDQLERGQREHVAGLQAAERADIAAARAALAALRAKRAEAAKGDADQIKAIKAAERGAAAAAANTDRLQRQMDARRNAEQRRQRQQAAADEIRELKNKTQEEVKLTREAAKNKAKEEAKAKKEADASARVLQRDVNRNNVRNEISLRRIGGDTVNNAYRLGRAALGVAGDVARGAGIDTSLSSAFQGRFDLNRAATHIAMQGFRENEHEQGFNSREAVKSTLLSATKEIALSTGQDPRELMKAVGGFVSINGDVKMATQSLKAMSEMALSTGSDLEQVGRLYGQFAAMGGGTLGAGTVDKLILAISGEGRAGAIEAADMVTLGPRLAAAAGQFTADPSLAFKFNGNGIAANVAQLGALSQLVREETKGTPKTAVQSVAAFADDMISGKVAKQLDEHGIRRFDTDKVTGRQTARNPFQVILDILDQTGANPKLMGDILKNKLGLATERAFTSTYRDAYDSTQGTTAAKKRAGRSAVEQRMDKMLESFMTPEGRATDVKFSENSPEGKAAIANQRIQQKLGDLGEKLLAKMDKSFPDMEAGVTRFTKAMDTASNNIALTAVAGVVAAGAWAASAEIMRRAAAGIADFALARMGVGGIGALGGVVLAGGAVAANAYGMLNASEAVTGATDTSVRHEGEDDLATISRVRALAMKGRATAKDKSAAEDAYARVMANRAKAHAAVQQGYGQTGPVAALDYASMHVGAGFFGLLGMDSAAAHFGVGKADMQGLGANIALARGAGELDQTANMVAPLMDQIRRQDTARQTTATDGQGKSENSPLYVRVVGAAQGVGGTSVGGGRAGPGIGFTGHKLWQYSIH